MAAYNGHSEVVTTLLGAGGYVNTANNVSASVCCGVCIYMYISINLFPTAVCVMLLAIPYSSVAWSVVVV